MKTTSILRGCLVMIATMLTIESALAATDKVCGGPRKGWRTQRDNIPIGAYVVTIDASGKIDWNGQSISQSRFDEYLNELSKHRSFLIFNPNKITNCSTVNILRSQLEKALQCSKGNCAENYKQLPVY